MSLDMGWYWDQANECWSSRDGTFRCKAVKTGWRAKVKIQDQKYRHKLGLTGHSWFPVPKHYLPAPGVFTLEAVQAACENCLTEQITNRLLGLKQVAE